MGQLAVSVAGAVVGSFFGMPQLGWLAGSLLGSMLFAPTQEGPRMTDLSVSASTYGRTIPRAWGTVRLGGNLIWTAGIKEHKKTKRAGKGGPKVTTYSYTCSFAMGFAAGPMKKLIRIWADGTIVYDVAPKQDANGNAKKVSNIKNFRFYEGNETQLPDPTIYAKEGYDLTPGYRGLCYIVFDSLPLEDYGNRIPQIQIEVASETDVTPPNDYPFTDLTPLSPNLFNNNSNDMLIPEYNRGEVLTIDQTGNPDGQTGFRIWSMKNGQEVRQAYGSEIGLTQASLSALGWADGMDIYVYESGGNSGIIRRINPTTLRTVGAGFGSAGSLLENRTYRFYSCNQLLPFTIVDSTGVRGFVWCNNALGGIGLLTADLQYVWGGEEDINTDDVLDFWDPPEQRNVSVIGNTQGGAATVYVAGCSTNPSTSDITLYRFDISGGARYDAAARISYGITHTPVITLSTTAIWGTSTSTNFNTLLYDQTDDSVLMIVTRTVPSGAQRMLKIRDGVVIWNIELPHSFNWGARTCTPMSRIQSSEFAMVRSDDLTVVDLVTGEILVNALDVGWTNDTGANIIDSLNRSITFININDGVTVGYWGRASARGVTLAKVVGDICESVGYDPAYYDVTDLASIEVRGFTVGSTSDARNAIQTLMLAYQFDCIERDNKLYFKRRGGGSSIRTINQRDLGYASSGVAENDYWSHTREQEADLPLRVQIAYQDIDRDYQQATQYAKRNGSVIPTVNTRKDTDVEFPIVFDASEAKSTAARLLYMTWAHRDHYATTLPWKHADLDPSDIVTVVMDNGDQYQVKIDKALLGADYAVEVETTSENPAVYSTIETASPGTFTPQRILSTDHAKLFIFDLPLLRDADEVSNGFRLYDAVAPYNSDWPGSAIYISSDAIDWNDMDVATIAAGWAVTVNALGPNNYPFSTDLVNTLTVRFTDPTYELESITDTELLDGGNAAVIGNEIIQFRDVVENPDGSWTLSYILRGRRGTEWACNSHFAGESMVMLDPEAVGTVTFSTSEKGATRFFRAVTLGGYLSNTPTESVKLEARALMPYAPVDLRRVTDGPDEDITFVRRTRVGGGLIDSIGTVPLGEQTEAYEAYILDVPYSAAFDPTNPLTYRRAYLGLTTPAFTYAAADMTADGFDPTTDDLHVVVFQLSAAVGRGFPGHATLPPD